MLARFKLLSEQVRVLVQRLRVRHLEPALDSLYSFLFLVKQTAKLGIRLIRRQPVHGGLGSIWSPLSWSVKTDRYQKQARAILGHSGVAFGSKTFNTVTKPLDVIIFNANVYVGPNKVWHGDINLSESLDNLIALALATERDVRVLHESDGRFNRERRPDFTHSVLTVTVNLDKQDLVWGERMQEYVEMRDDGRYFYQPDKRIPHIGHLASDYELILDKELRALYKKYSRRPAKKTKAKAKPKAKVKAKKKASR